MASDEFRHAAKQETLDASQPMRTNDDQIGPHSEAQSMMLSLMSPTSTAVSTLNPA